MFAMNLEPVNVSEGFEPLVPVYEGLVDGLPCHIVNARELHAVLGVQKDFSDWIKLRIKQYGFEKGFDYGVLRQIRCKSNGKWGHSRIDYFVTFDMARVLALVEATPQGRSVRYHLIEVSEALCRTDPGKPVCAAGDSGFDGVAH